MPGDHESHSLAVRAHALDAADPLADRRTLFDLGDDIVYLDGNSLGPPPRSVAARMDDVVRGQWGGLTGFFIDCVDALLGDRAPVASPRDPTRANQVSLRRAAAAAVMRELIDAGVIGDFRPPDLLRFGFSPLYVRFGDALRAADTLSTVLATHA